VSVIESTGGHSRGISRRVFVQSGQNTGRFPFHVRCEPHPPGSARVHSFVDQYLRGQHVTMSTAPLTLRTAEQGSWR
jgi:hypothetical protein